MSEVVREPGGECLEGGDCPGTVRGLCYKLTLAMQRNRTTLSITLEMMDNNHWRYAETKEAVSKRHCLAPQATIASNNENHSWCTYSIASLSTLTHSLTAALDQLRVVAISTTSGPGSRIGRH